MRKVILFLVSVAWFLKVSGQHLYPISTSEGCGFVDSLGETIVNPQFLECSYSYVHNVAYTKLSNGWQLLNPNGEPIIETRYDSISYWGKNIVLAYRKEGVSIFLSNKRRVNLKYEVDSLKLYGYKEKEYIQVFEENKTYLISSKGIAYFKELALDSLSSEWDNSFVVFKGGLQGIMNLREDYFLDISYDSIQYYDAGLRFYKEGKVGFKKRFFYRDIKTEKQSEVFFEAIYDDIRTFGKHFLKLTKGNEISLYDIEKRVIVADDLPENTRPFNQYYHRVYVGKKMGLCSLNGAPLTPAVYSKLLDSGHPTRVLFIKNGLYGFLNEKGIELTGAEFDRLYPFEAWGLLPRVFTKYKSDTLFGLINIDGDTLTTAKYVNIRLISDDRAACLNSDSSAIVYVFDKTTAQIDDWYNLSHIKQLSVVKQTKGVGIDNLYVGKEAYKKRYFSYNIMNKIFSGKDERFTAGDYSRIIEKEIDDVKLFLLFIPWKSTFDPTDEVFTVLSRFTREQEQGYTTDMTDEVYKSVNLIGRNIIRGVRTDGKIDFLSLTLRRMYLSYAYKYRTEKFLVTNIIKGNKYYPRIFEVEQKRKFKRYLLPYSNFTKNHIEPVFDSLILKQKYVFGRSGLYWDFAKPDTLSLPSYTLDLTLSDDMILSHQQDTSYYLYNRHGKEMHRFTSFELIKESENGIAFVKFDSLFNYLNPQGELILDSSVKKCSEFINGFANLYQNKKFSVINRKGEVVISSQQRLLVFNQLGSAIYYQNKKFGLIDTVGAIIDTAKYSSIRVIKGTNFFTFKRDKYGLEGILSSTGNVELPDKYKKIKHISSHIVQLELMSGKKGLYNLDTKKLINPKYDKVKKAGNESYIVSKGAKAGLYHSVKGWLVPVKYKNISGFRYGYATVKSKKENFYILENGNVVRNQPQKVYTEKVIQDTLYYDQKLGFVGLKSVNIPVQYHKIVQFEKNKCYVAIKFSKFVLHDYVGKTLLSSDTWLSAKILDNNVMKVQTVNGLKYYNFLQGKWF